ncbi:2113_t:CDS:2 [Cetraspora pellucida]|uniref:2113_t:CDS:1 n=1 Tax=Cetraspora pellucida TaxID=1433469 RepID=A0A9N9HVI8_9GLOM|nr:2113_t:CDS:2 [Cetraspora pellucida]
MELRKNSFAVNHSSIKTKMVEIIRSSARLAQDEAEKLAIANFKFSQHWLGHFLKRYDLSLHYKTNIAQKLPDNLENKLLKFQQFVICLNQKNNYPLDMIANMDEKPVWFDIVGNLTMNPRDIKTVYVRSTGNDKNRFTVVLTCLADGTKLLPNRIRPEEPHSKTMLVLDSFSAYISE